MLFPVRQLIEGREKPLCIQRKTSVHDALELMIRHDYSQLPVVTESGKLLGLVSEKSIIKSYFHTGGKVDLMAVEVDHCLEDAYQIGASQDLFKALGLLKNVYAVVVVEGEAPIAILTNYDTAHFFRDFSEGLMLVEDIEVSLRHLIEDTFPERVAQEGAFSKAFGPRNAENARDMPDLDRMTFSEIMLVINKNWPAFEKVLGNPRMFTNVMDPIREIRNQLAHFRGRLEIVQRDALLNGWQWLRVRLSNQEAPRITTTNMTPSNITQIKGQGLRTYLLNQRSIVDKVQVSLSDFETLNGETLPDMAMSHISWWGNDIQTHPQSSSWVEAGFRVKEVDFDARTVVFRRARYSLYQTFFIDLVERFKEAHPGLINISRIIPSNWIYIGNAKTGYSYYWTFTSQGTLRVELYFELSKKEENKSAFDQLLARKDEIEKAVGTQLTWDRLDARKTSRIYLSHPGEINDPPEKLEELKNRVVKDTFRLMNGLLPFINEAKV